MYCRFLLCFILGGYFKWNSRAYLGKSNKKIDKKNLSSLWLQVNEYIFSYHLVSKLLKDKFTKNIRSSSLNFFFFFLGMFLTMNHEFHCLDFEVRFKIIWDKICQILEIFVHNLFFTERYCGDSNKRTFIFRNSYMIFFSISYKAFIFIYFLSWVILRHWTCGELFCTM